MHSGLDLQWQKLKLHVNKKWTDFFGHPVFIQEESEVLAYITDSEKKISKDC